MGLLLLVLLVFAVLASRGTPAAGWRRTVRRAMGPALSLGGIGFAAGFFGPMLLAPDANQGPLLGIFITGPAGFALGLAYGLFREWRDRRPSSTAA